MGERVPIFPKNECYQCPANLLKRQIYCRFQGAQPLGGVWGGAPKELCVHRGLGFEAKPQRGLGRSPKKNLVTLL